MAGAAPAPAPIPSIGKTRPLYLYFEGQCYAIDQDQFVIGRGSKYSDLPIKDANISRRHCAIVRRDGGYYIKDLGSTNGVEFNGERVDNHRIEEGTLYRLCDHELRFSFIPPA
jgi:pSer/pThr/pTyr-binding forkhead associated (FHA) protein